MDVLKPELVYIIAGGLRAILDEFEGIIEWFVRKRLKFQIFQPIRNPYSIDLWEYKWNIKTFYRDWEDLLFPWIPFITRYTLGIVPSIFFWDIRNWLHCNTKPNDGSKAHGGAVLRIKFWTCYKDRWIYPFTYSTSNFINLVSILISQFYNLYLLSKKVSTYSLIHTTRDRTL